MCGAECAAPRDGETLRFRSPRDALKCTGSEIACFPFPFSVSSLSLSAFLCLSLPCHSLSVSVSLSLSLSLTTTQLRKRWLQPYVFDFSSATNSETTLVVGRGSDGHRAASHVASTSEPSHRAELAKCVWSQNSAEHLFPFPFGVCVRTERGVAL